MCSEHWSFLQARGLREWESERARRRETRQKNNISKIIRWRDYSVWVSRSASWDLSELARFFFSPHNPAAASRSRRKNKLAHTSVKPRPFSLFLFFFPSPHLQDVWSICISPFQFQPLMASPPRFPPQRSVTEQWSSCGLQRKIKTKKMTYNFNQKEKRYPAEDAGTQRSATSRGRSINATHRRTWISCAYHLELN